MAVEMSDMSTKNKIRFAIIGCGRMGRHHSEKMISDGRGEVVAVFDADLAMAERLKSDLWPAASVAVSMSDLASRSGIDAAIICTPTAEHHSQAKVCLERGWHVLCEKPLASNRNQILELIGMATVARSKGQAFSLGYQRRHTSNFRTLRREIQSGKWGKVRAVTSNNVEYWQSSIAGTWRDDPGQNPGGYVIDAGSHKIDILFYLTGLRPKEVFARSQKWGSHVEIVTGVSAILTEDVTVTMGFVGNAQYLGEDLHIHCERADLMLQNEELWIAHAGARTPLQADEPDSNPVTGLLDSILEGTQDLSPPESALPVFDMTQAIMNSGKSGIPVIVD